MTDTDTPMLRLYIFGRHTSKAGTSTNQPHGDDTYELAGTIEDLRRYAETGLQAEEGKFTPDSAHATRIYRNILRELDGADLSYYGATVYRTRYHGAPYGEAGEAGPATDNPRQLAEATLHRGGQWLEAIAPDGTRTQFKYSGQSNTRIEEVELPD